MEVCNKLHRKDKQYSPESKEYIFGSRLKAQRKKKKMTRENLAAECLVSIQAIKDWEQHYYLPKSTELLKLCDCLGCAADHLLGRIDEHEVEVHEICKKTGLSETACKELMDFAQAKERIRKADNWEPPYNDGMPVAEYAKERKKGFALSCVNLLSENEVLFSLLIEIYSYIGYANSYDSGDIYIGNGRGIEYDSLTDVSLMPDTKVQGAAHYIELDDNVLRAAQIRKIQNTLDSIKLSSSHLINDTP